jgi:hypothetical protein
MMAALCYAAFAAALLVMVALWRGHARTRRLLTEDYFSADSTAGDLNCFLDLGPNIFYSADNALVHREASPTFARKFREERTALALAWLRQARRRANSLIRVHAQSARGRADLKVSGEVRLALEFLAFQVVVALLHCAVSLRGPFHVAALVRYSLSIAGRLKQAAGEVTAGSLAPQSMGASGGPAGRSAVR